MSKPKKKYRERSLWEYWTLFTPPFIRLFAAHRTRGEAIAMTDEEIATASGLTVKRVQEIYWSKTWDNITILEAKKFLSACNADFNKALTRNMMLKYFTREAKFRHCYRSKDSEKYNALLKLYQNT